MTAVLVESFGFGVSETMLGSDKEASGLGSVIVTAQPTPSPCASCKSPPSTGTLCPSWNFPPPWDYLGDQERVVMAFDYPTPETALGFGNQDSGTTRRLGGGTNLLASVTSRRFGLDRIVHDGTFPDFSLNPTQS